MSKAKLVRFVVLSSAAMLMVVLLGVALTDAFGSDEPTSEPAKETAKTAKAPHPNAGLIAIAAAVSIAGGLLGAGFAVGKVGSAALGAASERPELITPALLFVAMGEGIGVLGLVGGILMMRYLVV